MNKIKPYLISGLTALVVAIGVVLGARTLSTQELQSSAGLSVMTSDGSVIGHTEPLRASSGPPVPACATTNTVLTCEGTGVPFAWNFPIGSGDSGIANEAFGSIVPGTYDSGGPGPLVIAKATLDPTETGQVSYTAQLTIPVPDGGAYCGQGDAGSGLLLNGSVIGYSVHNADASTATIIGADGYQCENIGSNSTIVFNTAGALNNLAHDGGTSYDFYLFVNGPGVITDASVGGIWVHEVP